MFTIHLQVARAICVRRSTARLGLAVAGAVLLAALMLAGCGGSQDDPPLMSLLRDIPANAGTRADIVINNLQALRVAAGLPGNLSIRNLTGGELNVLSRLPLTNGTALGSDLLAQDPDRAQLGYDPLRVNAELGVGNPPDEISIVAGTFSTVEISRALTSYGWTRQDGSADTYGGPINLSSPLASLLVNRITVGPSRLVGAGGGVSDSQLNSVLAQDSVNRSLASDPQIKTVLGLLGHGDTIQMGTSLVGGVKAVLGPTATPLELRELIARLGLEDLPRPTFAGVAMSNGTAWKTVTLYQSTRDAARAAPLIDAVMRHGIEPRTDAPYSRVAQLLSIHVDGTALVTTLTRSSEVPQMIENADLPPFF